MNSSIYFLLTFLLVQTSMVQAILQDSEFGDKLESMSKMLHSTCVALTSIDEDLIARVKTGDIPDDPVLKKYVKCLLVSSTAMDDNGELNKEFIMDIMPASLGPAISKTFDACAPKVKAASGLEDKAYTFLVCVLAENPDRGSVINGVVLLTMKPMIFHALKITWLTLPKDDSLSSKYTTISIIFSERVKIVPPRGYSYTNGYLFNVYEFFSSFKTGKVDL